MVLDTYDKDQDLLIFKNTYDKKDSTRIRFLKKIGLGGTEEQPKKFKIKRTHPNAPDELYQKTGPRSRKTEKATDIYVDNENSTISYRCSTHESKVSNLRKQMIIKITKPIIFSSLLRNKQKPTLIQSVF